jgi:hypothetical protein
MLDSFAAQLRSAERLFKAAGPLKVAKVTWCVAFFRDSSLDALVETGGARWNRRMVAG